MQSNLISKQIIDAQNNFNYFFMVIIIKVFKLLSLLAVILLISQLINNIIINIITLILTFYIFYKIYSTIDIYKYILDDIQNTLTNTKFNYIIDFKVFKNNLLRKEVKYGK